MEFPHRARNGGQYLRELRLRLGLTTRDVAQLSHTVACEEKIPEFAISHSWIIKVENEQSVPSIHKLFTLSIIYGTAINDLLSAYLNLAAVTHLHLSLPLQNTHLAQTEPSQKEKMIPFPAQFNEQASADKTNLLSRVVEVWGEIPICLLEYLSVRKCQYGFIGLRDYTMYPLIPPGSLVQIDDSQRTTKPTKYHTEYDRPIYFIELRTGFLCSWCEIWNGRLISIPHPLAPCRIQEFAFPSQAEIIGRVTGLAVRLVPHPAPQTSKSTDISPVICPGTKLPRQADSMVGTDHIHVRPPSSV